MGAPPLLVLPDPSQRRPFLSSPAFSPESCATSSSLSSSEFSFSSFSQSLTSRADLAPNILKQEARQEEEQQQHHNQNAVLSLTVRHKNCANSMQVTECSYTEPFRECKTGSTSCTKGVSMRKACCRNAGAFAADCAAISCCPCAVFSLLSFVLIDVPSALARKMAIRLQTRLCMKDLKSVRSRRGRENSLSICTPTWSCREASEDEGEKQVVTMFRFPTQNLLDHFHVGDMGFGCLSQKRE